MAPKAMPHERSKIARQGSFARLKKQLQASAGRVAAGRQSPLKQYKGPRKTIQRYELRRERGQRTTSSLVEFSARNPDEEDTVMEAQWRIRQALARENSITVRVASFFSRVIGLSATSASTPTTILDRIVLGSSDNASDRDLLYLLGITHICNCAAQVPNYFEGEFVYMKLHLHDSKDEDLIPHFQAVATFLAHTEELHGRVLIHCIAGVSRSPALLIAHLMINKHLPLAKAYSMVRHKRRIVHPNNAFLLQLAKFEMMLFGHSSVASSHDPDWNFFEWNELKESLHNHEKRSSG